MTIYEIAEMKFNKNPTKNFSFIKKLQESIEQLPPEIIISKYVLEDKYYDEQYRKYTSELYLRENIESFFCDYVSKYKLYSELENMLRRDAIIKYYKKVNPKEITLGGSLDIFVSKEEAQRITGLIKGIAAGNGTNISTLFYKDFFDYYSLTEIMEKLKLSWASCKKLISLKTLIVVDEFNGTKLFEKSHIDDLYEKQQQMWEDYSKNYYSKMQVIDRYGKAFGKYITASEEKIRRPINKKEVPILLISHFLPQTRLLYLKTDVDSLWEDYSLYHDLNSSSLHDPFEDFKNKVRNVVKVQFLENQKNTKSLWYQYVREFLYNTKLAEQDRVLFQINQFVRNTEVIFSVFKREIYTYSAREINSLYLNNINQINRSYQRDFYNFLKIALLPTFVIKEYPLPFNIKELNDPYSYENIKEIDMSAYGLNEYHDLYEYTKSLANHKQKAIQDAKRYIKTMNGREYQHYDSCWLYIIIQLTNNWRHSTIISQIPRIDLSNTRIQSLDWLEKNNPDVEDANIVIFQIGRYVTKINKTGVSAEGIFTIGEPLKIAFVTAISICEFRTRAINDSSQILIDLSGHLVPKYNPHKVFFNSFTSGFKFENRKMNRTLGTLIWSVLRHLGKGLKESQISRVHKNDQTTMNHYIKLSKKQVDRLVLEIFERNQFGFVTQYLSNILFGTESNKNLETERMVSLNSYFGGVEKIEATAGLINKLSNEKEQVISYLKELKVDELKLLYTQSLVGVLPTKQKYYQCIYAKCKFENEIGERPNCDTCSFAIINVYALSNIMDNYIHLMEKIVEEFDQVEVGEKQRLANHFFLLHQNVITPARIKYGREIVDGFVDGGTERIQKLGTLLRPKNLKEFRTKGVLIGGEDSGEKKSK